MEILFTLISFTALCIYALFFTSFFKVPNSVSPLLAVCFTMVYFTLFGVFDLLFAAGYLFHLLALAILLLFAFKKMVFPKISFWFAGFFVIGALMIIFFGIREPMLYSWDEFSFWGTAVKLMKLNHELPTTAEIGWAWIASQKPGLLTLGYLFEFFGDYKEWRIFVGLNVLALSLFTALLTPFKSVSKPIGALVLGIMFFVPYIFTINRAPLEPSNVYMNAHSDVPMAWAFCGVLVLYYILVHEKARLWPVFPAIIALTLTRDTALPFALIAWVIISFDLLFLNNDVSFFNLKGVKAKLAHIVAMLISILICFFGWSAYIAFSTGKNPLSDIGGTDQLSMFAMLTNGVSQLFGFNTTENFSVIMSNMFRSYFTLPLTMFGTGFTITIIIFAILGLSAFITKDKTHRMRCIMFGVLSFLGFVAYYIFIGFTFVFVFKEDVSTHLIGYERYLYPYYIAWFSSAVLLLALCTLNSRKGFRLLPLLALLSILAFSAFRFAQFIPPGMMFLDYHDGYLYERKELVSTSEAIIELLGEDENGKIYFISQGDDGNRWFQYSGDLLPLQLEYSFGGGTLSLPKDEVGGLYDYQLSIEDFKKYLIENTCEFVFVDRSNADLVQDFGSLFSDNLLASSKGEPVVYRVEQQDGDITLQLIGEVGV